MKKNINNLYNIKSFKYQIGNFNLIASDCDLELLCDNEEYDLFKTAVTMAINYMIENEVDNGNQIPDNLNLLVSKQHDTITLTKRVNNAEYRLSEPLQAWLDQMRNEVEMFL